jgi:hypothetical protein
VNESGAAASRFFCYVQNALEGPFELIELAGQIKSSHIDAETLICREGEEEWFPFHTLPEFATARDMPVEVIARHLEERERLQHSPRSASKVKSLFRLVAVWALGILVLAGVIVAFVQIYSAYTTPHDVAHIPWPTTEGRAFSVQCPVALKIVDLGNPGYMTNYRATSDEIIFGIEAGTFHDRFTDVQYEEEIQALRDGFIRELGIRIISSRGFVENGYYEQEISFVGLGKLSLFAGRQRFIGGKGKLFGVWAFAKPNAANSEIIDRFLASFQIH